MLVQDMRTKPLYSIGNVSEMTGVNSVTLRAWERRYGLLKPQRTPKGHRLYSEQDIDLIHTIMQNLEQGMSISKVSDQLKQARDPHINLDVNDPWTAYRQRMINAVGLFDEATLDSVYNETMSLYPVDIVTSRLIEPLLIELGLRWEKDKSVAGRIPVAEEHFFSVFIRNKLGARFHHRNMQNQGPILTLACLPGEQHEFGLLFFALAAHARGYRIILLGADMPVHELPVLLGRTASELLVLSGSERLSCSRMFEDLRTLLDEIDIPIIIGGDVCSRCEFELKDLDVSLVGTELTQGLSLIQEKLEN